MWPRRHTFFLLSLTMDLWIIISYTWYSNVQKSQIWPMEAFNLILIYFCHMPTGLWARSCFLWRKDKPGSLCTYPVMCLRFRHFSKKRTSFSSNQDQDVNCNCFYQSVNDSKHKFNIIWEVLYWYFTFRFMYQRCVSITTLIFYFYLLLLT